LRAPSTGSTQCQAWPATTASKDRPRGVPFLEFADLDLDPGLTGEVGHPGVDVDAEDGDTCGLVLASTDAGAAADIQEISAGAGRDDALDQFVGVGRPRPVVASDVYSERLCYLPQLVRHLLDRHSTLPLCLGGTHLGVYTTKPRPCQWVAFEFAVSLLRNSSPGFERL
jgi:hypothetical protein